jgi:hypothetical protein
MSWVMKGVLAIPFLSLPYGGSFGVGTVAEASDQEPEHECDDLSHRRKISSGDIGQV